MVDFWKAKKILITGHTGFKGSWLSLWLQSLQSEVIGYALPPQPPVNLFTEAEVGVEMVDIRGDIRDHDALVKAINKYQPEIVFHLAAQPLVRYSYQHPIETYSTNVMGTVNVLEACRHTESVRTIINITTDKCYENKKIPSAFLETDALGGYDPYSSSKACSELVTSAYRNSYFQTTTNVGLASARAGNVIGGGDWATDRLIPDLISACIADKPVEIRCPHAVRPWQHVLESLSGYLKLAEFLYHEPAAYAEAWNFGPKNTDGKSVQWVTNEIVKLWRNKPISQVETQSNLHETSYLMLDSNKALTQLSWQPKWDLKQALAATVTWYKNYNAGLNAKEITCNQIKEYMQT